MDKKDFIFPGIILVLVVVVGIGLLVTHSDRPTLVPTIGSSADATASSSATSSSAEPSSSVPATSAEADQGIAPPATPPSAHSSYYPYGSVTLALGQAAGFKDGTSIRPMHVLEDSRCPMGVMCIQAGTVKLSIKANGVLRTVQIGQSIQIGGDSVTLESVEPQRSQHGYPSANEYRFIFSVTHAG